MAARPLRVGDIAWAVERLRDRRSGLAPFAPVLWRPALHAAQLHEEYMTYLLGDGGAVGFRTDTELMIAQRSGPGWVIDDVAIHEGAWTDDGEELWRALSSEISERTRVVCPVPDPALLRFMQLKGLRRVESWWHWNTPLAESAATRVEPSAPGGSARLVRAPPIYDPGGPILFLSDVEDGKSALVAARQQAREVGAPVVVVNQPVADAALHAALESTGFVRHCDFLEGDPTTLRRSSDRRPRVP